MQRTSVIFKNPYEIEAIQSPLPSPGDDEVLIKARISAISAGTELLIFRGQFPSHLPVDESIPTLARPFGYPLKYGYASVGKVVEIGRSVKKELLGSSVFCFHPHESHYVIRQDQLIPLPADIDTADAVFLATMETAVNFLMDGRPVIGENVVIFGLGIVGLLTTALMSRLPLGDLVVMDPYSLRRQEAKRAGARVVMDPNTADVIDEGSKTLQSAGDKIGADLVYELSGNPSALNQALAFTGPGSRIVIGSWYGTKKAELDLGGRFHRNRIRLISSQVSTIAPQFSDRWTKSRRIEVALDMIRQLNPARFVTHKFDVQQAAEAYELLDKRPQEAIQVLLTYE
ncbi:MAG: zinc-binding alcohol dehydrogenase [Desulfobacterales bacterium]|nr:MAG: zinc-binding alcohol dehydrogenase [Desulfobacterales bacterium]